MNIKLLTKRNTFILGSLFTIGLLFSACKKTDNSVIQPPTAVLMAFNLVPDQTGVQVTLSNNPIPSGVLPYTSYSGNYFSIYSGSRTVQSYGYINNLLLDSSTYNFDQNKYYSLFVMGNASHYKNVISVDNFDSLSSTNGKAYIRYVNAVPDSSTSMVTIGTGGTNAINANSTYGQVSGFVAVDPGTVDVALNNEGKINKTRTVTLVQQKAYTLLFSGLANATDSTKAVKISIIENGTITQ